MNIKAAGLYAYGCLEWQPAPRQRPSIEGKNLWIRPLRPAPGDDLIENGSISYGFSAAVFAALIILCGFCPRDSGPKRSRHSTSYYGQIQVADYGQFSQIARFDAHYGFRDAVRSFKTDMRDLPVAHCLNLAFGIIPVKGRGRREWVIPYDCTAGPNVQSRRALSPDIWNEYAVPQQLIRIRYSFERFAGTSQIDIADYSQSNEAFEAEDVRVLQDLLSSSGVGDVSRNCSTKKTSQRKQGKS